MRAPTNLLLAVATPSPVIMYPGSAFSGSNMLATCSHRSPMSTVTYTAGMQHDSLLSTSGRSFWCAAGMQQRPVGLHAEEHAAIFNCMR